jgi:putative ABC transport system permease protein
LLAIAPADLPRVSEAGMSQVVILFTFGLAVGVGLLTGLLPALSAIRTNPAEGLGDSRRSTANSKQRFLRSSLVVAEVTLATCLTIGAVLLLRSFAAVMGVNPGFAPEHVLTFQVSAPAREASLGGRLGFYSELNDKLKAIPGVTSVGGSSRIPLGSTLVSTQVRVEGRDTAPPDRPEAQLRTALYDYFGTMQIPVQEGRVFREEDRTAQEGLAVVNRTLATRLFPNASAIDHRIQLGPNASVWLRIIGVVGDVHHSSLEELPEPEVYTSHFQGPPSSPFIAVRTTGEPTALTSAVRAALADLGAPPPASVRTLEELRNESVRERRFVLWLAGSFGVFALVLAGVGVYGVIALVVSERTAEVGVRLALGATPGQVWSLLVSQAGALGAYGVALGAGAALALTPLAAALLFGVSPADPLTFASVALLIMLISLVAAAIPARRAMKVDPATALRT